MALLSLVALVVRVRCVKDGIWGDEVFSLRETRGRGLFDVVGVVAHGEPGQARLEDNPPLFFLLAWLGEQVGDPTAWVRLPSVVAGTLTVPVVWLLGRRTVGAPAALAGAAFMAVAPFPAFYGSEARAYALLTFLAALSTLVLLLAVERARPAWWAAYAVAVAAMLYAHYTGAVVVAVHVAWMLVAHRDRWRPLGLAVGAVALAYLPWLPNVDGQPADFDLLAKLLHISYSDALTQWLVGLPEFQPHEFPGTAVVVLLAVGLAVGVAGRLATARAGRRLLPRASSPAALVAGLALAMPVAALLYGFRGPDLFLFPRNLSASLPFVALVLGVVVTPPRRAAAAVAVALAGTAILVVGVRAQERAHRRPDLRGVSEAIDAQAGPRDLTFFYGAGLGAVILGDGVRLYAHEPHPSTGSDTEAGQFARRLAAHAGSAPRTFVVSTSDPAQQPPPAAGWTVTASRTFPGHPTLVLRTYERGA